MQNLFSYIKTHRHFLLLLLLRRRGINPAEAVEKVEKGDLGIYVFIYVSIHNYEKKRKVTMT